MAPGPPADPGRRPKSDVEIGEVRGRRRARAARLPGFLQHLAGLEELDLLVGRAAVEPADPGRDADDRGDAVRQFDGRVERDDAAERVADEDDPPIPRASRTAITSARFENSTSSVSLRPNPR